MKLGLPYTVSNTVIEFEQDRRIAWQTVLSGPLGRFLGGRIWRYELEPVDGGTKVTESWDLSQDKQAFFLKNPKVGQHTAASMSKTLERLAEITAS
jgi:fructosamine-3-kinase